MIFDEYYLKIFENRWGKLRAALLCEAAAIPFSENLLKPYFIDRASVIAAETLRLPETGEVLDACAAPGGKSLVIASHLGNGARLIANEL